MRAASRRLCMGFPPERPQDFVLQQPPPPELPLHEEPDAPEAPAAAPEDAAAALPVALMPPFKPPRPDGRARSIWTKPKNQATITSNVGSQKIRAKDPPGYKLSRTKKATSSSARMDQLTQTTMFRNFHI